MSNSKVPVDLQFGDAVFVIRRQYVDNQMDPFDEGDPITVVFEDGTSVSTDEPDLVAVTPAWGEDD
jgi:hypothetical protein